MIWLLVPYLIAAEGPDYNQQLIKISEDPSDQVDDCKDDVKTLVWSEFSAAIFLLIFNYFAYKNWGLNGLGYGFLVGSLFAYLQTFIIVKTKYNFFYSNNFIKVFFIQILIGVFILVLTFIFKNKFYCFSIMLLLLIISISHSFIELNKRLIFKNINLK